MGQSHMLKLKLTVLSEHHYGALCTSGRASMDMVYECIMETHSNLELFVGFFCCGAETHMGVLDQLMLQSML